MLLAGASAAGVLIGVQYVRRKQGEADAERESLRRTTEQLKYRNGQLNALYNIFSEITATLSLQYVADATLRETLQLMDAHGAVLFLVRDGVLVPIGGQTSAGRPIKGLTRHAIGEGLMGKVAKHGRTQRVDDQNEDMLTDAQRAQGVHSGILVPLIVGARVVGLLNCWSTSHNAFSDEDQRILEMMASQVATAVAAADSLESTEHQAHYDALTDLPNRHQLNEDLDGKLKQMADSGRPAVVAMLDVDHFKALNDDFGHKIGDDTLQQIARVVRSSVRDHDMIYRYGGEEFLLILPDAGIDDAVPMAERVRSAVELTSFCDELAEPLGKVTVSLGMAVLAEHAHDFVKLIEMADKALYEAKQSGRNRVVLWQDHRETRAAA